MDVEGCLDRMIALDFIIVDEDRHFGNFGILRDLVTLKVKVSSPYSTVAHRWVSKPPPYGSTRGTI